MADAEKPKGAMDSPSLVNRNKGNLEKRWRRSIGDTTGRDNRHSKLQPGAEAGAEPCIQAGEPSTRLGDFADGLPSGWLDIDGPRARAYLGTAENRNQVRTRWRQALGNAVVGAGLSDVGAIRETGGDI